MPWEHDQEGSIPSVPTNPWASEADPKAAFFDLDNVAFSHAACNQREMIERLRIYPNMRAYKRAGFSRYFAKKSSQGLSRKRDRYKIKRGISQRSDDSVRNGEAEGANPSAPTILMACSTGGSAIG